VMLKRGALFTKRLGAVESMDFQIGLELMLGQDNNLFLTVAVLIQQLLTVEKNLIQIYGTNTGVWGIFSLP